MSGMLRLGLVLCGTASVAAGYIKYNSIEFSRLYTDLNDARNFAASQPADCHSKIIPQKTLVDQSEVSKIFRAPPNQNNTKQDSKSKFNEFESFESLSFSVEVKCSEDAFSDVLKVVLLTLFSSISIMLTSTWIARGFKRNASK